MIRKGRYALWNDEEYQLISFHRKYYLKSRDESDLSKGFLKLRGSDQYFVKCISIQDLDIVYEVFQYAMLSSYRFSVESYNATTDTVSLVTYNPFVKKSLNVLPYGSKQFIIEVFRKDIEIEEEQIPVLGFEENQNYWTFK